MVYLRKFFKGATRVQSTTVLAVPGLRPDSWARERRER